jgi:hypothetical protein
MTPVALPLRKTVPSEPIVFDGSGASGRAAGSR